jgi:hypothetical protein
MNCLRNHRNDAAYSQIMGDEFQSSLQLSNKSVIYLVDTKLKEKLTETLSTSPKNAASKPDQNLNYFR